MRSGTLTAKDSKSRRFIYLAPDEILILTEGERRGTTVEEILIQEGKVSEKVLAKARERQKKLGTDLGYILEKQGIIPYNEIERLRKKRAFEEVEDLFHWPEVSIEFEPNHLMPLLESPEADVLSIRMNVWEMLETIVDRIEEWIRIRKVVTSLDLVFLAVPPEDRRKRVVHPLGEKILDLADGRTSLKTIFDKQEGDWFESYRALKKLLDARLIRVLKSEEAQKEAQNALVFNEQDVAEVLLKSVLAQQPGNNKVRRKLESLKRKTTTRRRRAVDTVAKEVKLSDVLSTVVGQARSGTLTAKGEGGACTLYVSAERILFLPSGERHGPFLGEVLVECGFAKPAQIDKALDVQQKTRKKLGEILVLQGVVTEERLGYGLKEKLLAEIRDLFRWESARFHFDEGDPPEALTEPDVPVTDVPANGHALLKEALARESAWKEIEKLIPSDKAIFLRLDTEVRKKGDAAKKNPILQRINGKRTLDELLSLLPGSRFAILRDLARMVRAQSVRALTADEAKKAGNEAYMFNEFKSAIALYEWTLELKPDDAKVKANLERARSFLGG
ncbi:MAG: DUF4388 domain-containing protein, partial [Planctomycetota bacterium]|jgi:hypothetical protein